MEKDTHHMPFDKNFLIFSPSHFLIQYIVHWIASKREIEKKKILMYENFKFA